MVSGFFLAGSDRRTFPNLFLFFITLQRPINRVHKSPESENPATRDFWVARHDPVPEG